MGFVAERDTGKILVYEVSTGSFVDSIETGMYSIGGLAFSPTEQMLYFVDEDTNSLYKVKTVEECASNGLTRSRLNPNFVEFVKEAKQTNLFRLLEQQDEITDVDNEEEDYLSLLYKSYQCKVDPIIANSSLFEQVHDATGYASNDTNVQSTTTGMDDSAVLLANRTDCGFDSELNFDQLLLGGYFCHICLPERELTCGKGGTCTNVQWNGWTCDNEYYLHVVVVDNNGPDGERETKVKEYEIERKIVMKTIDDVDVNPSAVRLQHNVEYTFVVVQPDESEICWTYYSDFHSYHVYSKCLKGGGSIVLDEMPSNVWTVRFRIGPSETERNQSDLSLEELRKEADLELLVGDFVYKETGETMSSSEEDEDKDEDTTGEEGTSGEDTSGKVNSDKNDAALSSMTILLSCVVVFALQFAW